MKSLLTTIIVVSFIDIAVLGIFVINHDGHDAMASENCIAATIKGVNCPKGTGLIDYVAFHVNAFKGFPLIIFGESVISTLLLAFALLFFIGFAFFAPRLFKPFQLAFCKCRFRDSFSPLQKKLTRWLALHENSPAIV